jgi:hypothetical protein
MCLNSWSSLMFLSDPSPYEADPIKLKQTKAALSHFVDDSLNILEMTRSEFDDFIQNADNFFPSDWQFMQQELDAFRHTLDYYSSNQQAASMQTKRDEMRERSQWPL